MPVFDDYEVAAAHRPSPDSFAFDLDTALKSVVALEATVPEDAFTAEVLGTERIGNGVVIRADGLVLTIGYLVTEAASVKLTTHDGRAVPGHVLGVDLVSGFGLVQALEPLDVPALPIGDSRAMKPGDAVVTAGAGGRKHAAAAQVMARQPFAGYWEYLLDAALFVSPAHPHWSGAALIGPKGELLGIGSLQLESQAPGGRTLPLNMVVPIETLADVYEGLLTGRDAKPPRPWLGVYAQEIEGRVTILGVSPGGPASRAELRQGDVVLAVDDTAVDDLADFYTAVWGLGDAGVTVPLTLDREGDVFDVEITSVDRRKLLRKPRFH
ncbi:MAG: serine protease [Caulobacteraceae bacterium]|nr:serine protease [Caulobacter sp.]